MRQVVEMLRMSCKSGLKTIWKQSRLMWTALRSSFGRTQTLRVCMVPALGMVRWRTVLTWACLSMASTSARVCSTLSTLVLGKKALITRFEVRTKQTVLCTLGWWNAPECLDFFVGNQQCKHIIFGACHDSGYAPYLGRFAAEVSIRDRITLLRGAAIHPRIAALGFQKTLKLEHVFTPHMVDTIPVSASKSSPPVRATSSTLPIRPLTAATGFSNTAALSNRLGPVIRNKEGKRIDKLLDVDITSPYLGVIRQNRLCPWFYLRGRCEGCDRNHRAPPLNARESDYLWYHARHGLCHKVRKDKDCEDPKCVYGHEEGHQIGSGKASK